MKVWVNVNRKKAILAGKNEEGWKLVEVDMGKLSQEEREYVAQCPDDYYRWGGENVHAQRIDGTVGETTEEAVIQRIREQIIIVREEKKQKAEQEKKEAEEREKAVVVRLNALPESLLISEKREMKYDIIGWKIYTVYRVKDDVKDARLAGKYAEVQKIAETKNAEEQARIQAEVEASKQEIAAKEKAKQEKEAAKEEQIRGWVAEKGTENQKKRYEIALLPESEVVDAIRDETYAALNDFPRYEKMKASDVCTCEDRYEGYCDVDYEVEEATEATAEEFEALEKIVTAAKKAHPGAVVTLMDHIGTSEDCENKVVRKSAKVEVAVGAFKFSREYAI